MAGQPSGQNKKTGSSGTGRSIVFYLRLGLASTSALVLVAIVMAWSAFGAMSTVLDQITAEAMPYLEHANRLMQINGKIESQARNLPNLRTPFAVASTMFAVRGLKLELETALGRIDPEPVSGETMTEVEASLDIMNRQVARLSRMVEQRFEVESHQADRIRRIDELGDSINEFGESMLLSGPWGGLKSAMSRSIHMVVISLASPSPALVMAGRSEYEEQMARVRALLPDEESRLQARAVSILEGLESCRPFFDDRLRQLQLELRIRNSVKGLAIMERLDRQVASMSSRLTSQARERADNLKATLARLRWGLSGLSILCLAGLFMVLRYIDLRLVRRMKGLQSAMLSHVDGHPRPIDISGADEISDMAASFMYYVDQAGQRAASLEERTRELNEALGSLLEKTGILNTTMQSMHQGLIMVDKDMKVVSYNDNLARLFDPEASPIVGTPDFSELHRQLYVRTGPGEELLRQCLEKAKSRDNLSFEQRLADDRILEIHQKPLAGGGFVRTYTDITERKRAEEALRESERRLADIIEFLPDPTLVLDGEGRVAAWNQAMEDLTGLKKDVIVGKGDYEYALPFYGQRRPLLADLVGSWNEDYAKTYRSVAWKGDRLHMESFHPNLGQGGVYLSGTARALHDSSGNRVGAIESLRDVTERRRVEERYETMAANVPGAIFQAKAGPEGLLEFTYVSPGCEEHFHVSPEDLTSGRRNLEIHPRDREGFTTAVQEAVQGLHQLEFVGQLAAPPGQRKWFRMVAKLSRDTDGGIVFNGLILDVTKRKLAERESLASERKLSAMSRAVEDALIMMDSQGRVRFWNPAAEKLFGYGAEEAQGLNLHDIVAPAEVRERAREGMKRFASTGEGRFIGHTLEAEAFNRHGRTFPVELTISSYQVDGEWFAVGTARDITERKRAEEELKQHVADLERFNRLTIGREERMIRLKTEVNRLLEDLGRGPKYRTED